MSRVWLRLAPILAAALVYVIFIAQPREWNAVIWPQAMASKGALFLDLHGHLASSAAHAAGTLENGVPVAADPLQRIHLGPRWMLWLGYLGLGPADTLWFAGVCIALFLIGVAIGVRVESGGAAVGLFLAVTAPSVLLLVERGNIDLFVFFSMAIAFCALAAEQAWMRWTGWGILATFIGFKYFPSLAFAGVLETRGPRRERAIALLLAVALVGAFVAWTWEEIRYVSSLRVQNIFFPLFGAGELPRLLGLALPQFGVIAAVVGLSAGWAGLLGPLTAAEAAYDRRKIAFGSGAAVVGFCFAMTSSPDYRLVFALFCFPWLWRQAADRAAPHRLRVTAGLALTLFVAVPWWGVIAGRYAANRELSQLFTFAMILKQAGWWTLVLGLLALQWRLMVGAVRR